MSEKLSSKFELADSREESADSLREKDDQTVLKEEFETELRTELQSIDQELDEELSEDFINLDNLQNFIGEHYPNNENAYQIAHEFLEKQSVFGLDSLPSEVLTKVDLKLNEISSLNKEDQIKGIKTDLQSQGKNSEQILKILVEQFGGDTEIPALLENWRKFQRLHELAKTKSPQEQKVIQKIISKADFSNENAFAFSLNAIQSSTELSDQTKLEISMEFDGSNVNSINQMDAGLSFLKNQKQQINSALNTKVEQLDSIDSDIKNLRNKIENLPADDPKIKELEDQLSQKKDLLKNTQDQVEFLESQSKRDIAFEVRKGFFAKLHPDGSRSLKIPENFSLKLPTNALPLMGMKNLRTANLSFMCSPLIRLGILDDMFSPNMVSGAVPMKVHRDMAHFILDTLGIDDKRLLSEKDILQLDRDLSRLMDSKGTKSPQEHLADLGIYDIADQFLNKKQFKRALEFVRDNRHVKDDIFFNGLLHLKKSKTTIL